LEFFDGAVFANCFFRAAQTFTIDADDLSLDNVGDRPNLHIKPVETVGRR